MPKTSETFSSGGLSLPLDIFVPASPRKVPAVLVLHGSFCLLPQYLGDIFSFAEALAEHGIAAAIPHYLDSTGTAPGTAVFDEVRGNHLLWRRTCADALTAMADDDRFDNGRIGVLGFSLGGFLALSLAMDPSDSVPTRGVVDFFGPTHLLDPDWSRLPPALIFHGADDPLVDPDESARLVAELEDAGRTEGRDFFYHVYPGQGHGFAGAALATARERTVEFFDSILQVRH